MNKIIKMTKRQKKIADLGIESRAYSLSEALKILFEYKSSCAAKFDETVELVCKLGIDPRHSDQNVRGAKSLPAGTGKTVRVAVFVAQEMLDQFKGCGADILASDELLDTIKNGGAIEFDSCVCTPSYMPTLAAKIGKVLGPKGLMPNPKLGTVTEDVAAAVAEMKSGRVEFRAEKSGIVHVGVGKLSFDTDALTENIDILVKTLKNAKPSGAKGEYFRSIFITTTMGPSIELDRSNLVA